jgi:hypothetical protein
MPTAYGRGPYGVQRYAGYSGGPGRPYGVGGYGTGPYARYGANTYDVQGRTGIAFGVKALPHLTHQINAVSSITFAAWATGLRLTVQPAAVSQIVFDVHVPLELSWTGWAPCEPGGWQPAGPGDGGAWAPPGGCSTGTWAEIRLEQTT